MDNSLIDMLLVLWFLITGLCICFWIIGNTISNRILGEKMKYTPQIKEIEKVSEMIGNWIISALIGIWTGTLIYVLLNWINCSYYECNMLRTPHYLNGWLMPAIIWIIITIAIVCFFIMMMKEVIQKYYENIPANLKFSDLSVKFRIWR